MASSVCTRPLPFKADSLIYTSSGNFTPETGSLLWLKILGLPRTSVSRKYKQSSGYCGDSESLHNLEAHKSSKCHEDGGYTLFLRQEP